MRIEPLATRATMNSDEIILDALLLEEVSIFLSTSDQFLLNTPLTGNDNDSSIEMSVLNTHFPVSSPEVDLEIIANSSRELKRKARREKEVIRKKRYEQRLKNERETLRRMEKLLTTRLTRMKKAHETSVLASDVKLTRVAMIIREFARRECKRRHQAEEEQKRLIDAITVQASYLATLQQLLSDPSKAFSVNVMEMSSKLGSDSVDNRDIAMESVFLDESSSDIDEMFRGLVEVEEQVQRSSTGTRGVIRSNSHTTTNKQPSNYLTSRQKQTLRKKRYERRLKNEREALRDLVSELTTQLTQLKRGKSSKNKATVEPAVTYSVWRALTIVRRQERRQAEDEQRRLEAAIDEQATYLATLRALLPKYFYDWVAITEVTRVAIVSSRQANMQANHILFAEHLRQVFADFTLVDEVFSDFDVLTLPDGMSDSKVDGAVEFFSHFNKCTLPFSFEQTHKVWWNLTNLNQWVQDGDGYAELADPNDTVILRIRLVRTLPSGMTVSVMQRYILRRFVDETQAVFLWKTYVEGEGPLTGTYLEETGWARLQPSTDEDSTIVAVCVHQTPMQIDTCKPHTVEGQQFYNLMQGILKENAEIITMRLTNKLLEDTFGTN